MKLSLVVANAPFLIGVRAVLQPAARTCGQRRRILECDRGRLTTAHASVRVCFGVEGRRLVEYAPARVCGTPAIF